MVDIMADTMDIQDTTDTDTTAARSVGLTLPFSPLLMPPPLLFPILATVLVLATLMEHPFFTELFPTLTLLPTRMLLSPPAKLKLMLKLLPWSMLLIMSDILMLMVIWVVTTDSPFLLLPLPLPKNPQLLKPERNVKLSPKLGIMATTDMDMVDTTD